jgi:hypothetical protein
MELYLRDNDVTKTRMITSSGEELYKTETHPGDRDTTVVIRYERNAGIGLVALEVGKIEALEPRGTRLLLYAEHKQLVLWPPSNEEADKCVIRLEWHYKPLDIY